MKQANTRKKESGDSGYIRVSSTDQSQARQPKALRNAGDDRTHSFGVQVGHAPPEPPQNPAEGDPPVTSSRSGGDGTDGSVGMCSGGGIGTAAPTFRFGSLCAAGENKRRNKRLPALPIESRLALGTKKTEGDALRFFLLHSEFRPFQAQTPPRAARKFY